MKRLAAALLTVGLAFSAAAFSAPSLRRTGELEVEVREKNPWNHLNLRNQPENFQFAVVTDRTGGHRPGVFEKAVGKINLMQPEFVVSVGDLIEGYSTDRKKLSGQWNEFNEFIQDLEMPFFYTPGNHDISNLAMQPEWELQFDRKHYHFIYRDVLFLILNSEDEPGYKVEGPNGKAVAPGKIGPAQLAWLNQTMKKNADVRWTLVFLHKPMWQYGERTNWAEVEMMFGDRPITIFAGHHHKYRKEIINGRPYYALATTGGGSKLRGPVYGEFDHFAWITMTPRGPQVANVLLDGVLGDDPVSDARAVESRAVESRAENGQKLQPAGAK